MLLIIFAITQVAGHVVELPSFFSLLAPLIFAFGVGLNLVVDVIDRACVRLVGLPCWLTAEVSSIDFLTRALRAEHEPPRLEGA